MTASPIVVCVVCVVCVVSGGLWGVVAAVLARRLFPCNGRPPRTAARLGVSLLLLLVGGQAAALAYARLLRAAGYLP